MLRDIVTGLATEGYDITEPTPGKACHAASLVRFPHVHVSLVLLVRRHNGCVAYQLLTWPSQTSAQRLSRHRLKPPGDCKEWSDVCATVNAILVRDERLNSVRSVTFSEGESVPGWE